MDPGDGAVSKTPKKSYASDAKSPGHAGVFVYALAQLPPSADT